MKIAILGARGFVGGRLFKYLEKSKYSVVPITRQDLDLLNSDSVKLFLQNQKFDVIINAAAVMTNNDSIHDTRNNLGIFMNFYHNYDLFGKFINLASGAEYDRTMNIENINEEEIFHRLPADSYGFGQNIKSRLSWDRSNFYNIRIFNCFGVGEYATRIFTRYLNQGILEITNNRYFDYFSIDDLCSLVEHCVLNTWNIKDVNAVYKEKYLIDQVLDLFCSVNNLAKNFSVVSHSEHNYTGSADKVDSLAIRFKGLEKGLEEYTKKE